MKIVVSFVILSIIAATEVSAQIFPDMEKAIRGMNREKEGGPDTTLKLGEKFQDLKLEDIAGNIIDTAKIRKNKLLLIRFVTIKDDMWEIETDILNIISEQFMDTVAILDIVVPPMTPEMVIQQYENARAIHSIAYDKKNIAATQFGLAAKHIPSSFIFDVDGSLLSFGRTVPRELPERLTKLLKERQEKKEMAK